MTDIYRTEITLVHRDPTIEGKSFESTIQVSSLYPECRLPLEQMEQAISKIYSEVESYKATQ